MTSLNIFIPREAAAGEKRVPVVAATADRLVKLGATVEIEAGLGDSLGAADADYVKAGAVVSADRKRSLGAADLVLRLRKPPREEIAGLKKGGIHISYLDSFNEHDLIREFAKAGVSAISLEMIPRTTLAQKMDVLSSQASLAGYAAVILAAERLNKIFPMMMTPAGTISPARVFIVGVGVAGLQAIATAKRLGAMVEAFDTRPVVEEQVKSLGAKFVKIDLGATEQTKDGYAKALTEEQLAKQRAGMAKICANSDVVITTAQVFGRKAPRILTTDMIKGMKPGSIVVDLAADSGGNVECTRPDEEIMVNGVRIVGIANMPGRVCVNASQMFSNNLGNFVEQFWNKQARTFDLKIDDEIIKGCLITHGGQIVHQVIKDLMAKGGPA